MGGDGGWGWDRRESWGRWGRWAGLGKVEMCVEVVSEWVGEREALGMRWLLGILLRGVVCLGRGRVMDGGWNFCWLREWDVGSLLV